VPAAIAVTNITRALNCMQDKLDKKFDIAFGVAGLAQLASGFALVLILAGENVSGRHHQHACAERSKHHQSTSQST
jgi:hypothetical protein